MRSGSLVPPTIVATRPAASVCLMRLGRMLMSSPRRTTPGRVRRRTVPCPGCPRCHPKATADRLTVLLRRADVLGRGDVVDVAVGSSRDTLLSRVTRLRLTYDRQGEEGPSRRRDLPRVRTQGSGLL